MTLLDVLQLLCGLALFLYGMNVMGDALKKSAGKSLKTILGTLTSSPLKGFLLGLMVTVVIQSSSATTVMVVGFVNSATMTLTQAIGVIMGANVGTAITAWLTALNGLGGDGGKELVGIVSWLKPDAWMPILAVIGICLTMFAKKERKKDIGVILLGFAVLMTGMDVMSSSVAGLKSSEAFKSILTMFENPILGILAGLILTAIVQSSSASVGILQSLTVTGAITYGAAIPIVMGQNIGTCVTALLSCLGASKNAKRAALAHLYFNIIGVVFWMTAYSILNAIFNFAFASFAIDMWGVALVHTVFKILSVILIMPFSKQLEKLATVSVKDSAEDEQLPILDERLIDTPAVAVESAKKATVDMAILSCEALRMSLRAFTEYDDKLAAQIRSAEDKADIYEDMLGTYLIKLTTKDMDERDSHEITKLLHLIGDFERISDHAVDLLCSAEEMRDKKLQFSNEAKHELTVMTAAIDEIVQLAMSSFTENQLMNAAHVEPLEEVVDYLKDQIKLQHVLRLQKSECTIEHGFVLADILNALERVSDHCSNIAGCVIEISQHDSLSMHSYLSSVRAGGEEFDRLHREYMKKYTLKKSEVAASES
ncbi:MAG: Na/Pi cotransporter family protein [Clostridia bacterium]|nr:Na/Pi cotransporter family protein [Clostridia bacterium]